MALTSNDTPVRGNPGADGNRTTSLGRASVARIVLRARLLWPLLLLVTSLMLGVIAALLSYFELAEGLTPAALYPAFAVTAILAFGTGLVRLRSQLLKPLVSLEESVAQVCQGEPGASLSPGESGVLRAVVRDIDSLSEELTDLYEDMDNRVARQTARLAQKTASLKILYDAADSINRAHDLDELLIRFLRVLKEMVNGRTATVRLAFAEGRMRLVACIGLDGDVVREGQLLPVRLCQCGKALTPADILCDHGLARCAEIKNQPMFSAKEIERVTVPLEYHGKVLGIYTIFVPKPGISEREDILELLSTIGSHLGMAVAKQRSDAEARRLSILEERNNLAHELHDSLAQTLASLRYQVRMLAETLDNNTDPDGARLELARIRNGLDEANTELRELLNSFRAPVDQRGLIPALEMLVVRFRQETGIAAFMQKDCRQIHLSANEEMQMLRIVQEALANTRKHAGAQTVRVFLRCRARGQYLLLVEDDGVGFQNPVREDRPGEHIGLSIMQERARRLGAELRIESEPGEGTRVELTFRPADKLRDI